MSNAIKTSCPSDPGCEFDPRRPRAGCIFCGLGICWGCDSVLDPAELHHTHWVPGEHAPGPLCERCLADSGDGVPEYVDPEETQSEKTVRIDHETVAEVAATWIEKMGRAA